MVIRFRLLPLTWLANTKRLSPGLQAGVLENGLPKQQANQTNGRIQLKGSTEDQANFRPG